VSVAPTHTTFEAFQALVEQGKRVELVDGIVTELAPPSLAHGFTAMGLGDTLGPLRREGGGGPSGAGWWIVSEVEILLPLGRVFRPDVAGWRRERLTGAWERWPVDVVPDWICEIVSKGTEGRDRLLKRHHYASAGVAHYWILDPALRSLEALMLRDGLWVEQGAFGDDAVVRLAPFESIEIRVGDFFPPMPPSP
jgi:Uma2 family endonuclease